MVFFLPPTWLCTPLLGNKMPQLGTSATSKALIVSREASATPKTPLSQPWTFTPKAKSFCQSFSSPGPKVFFLLFWCFCWFVFEKRMGLQRRILVLVCFLFLRDGRTWKNMLFFVVSSRKRELLRNSPMWTARFIVCILWREREREIELGYKVWNKQQWTK